MKIVRNWTQEEITTLETMFRSANGYLDIRNAPEEGAVSGSSRSSHLHVHKEPGTDPCSIQIRMITVPDAQTVRLFADGVPYSMFSEDTVSRIQEIDTQNGFCVRTSVWQLPQGTMLVRFLRMASTEIPGLFLHRMQLESLTYEGKLRIETDVDAGEPDEKRALDSVEASIEKENEGLIVCRNRGVLVVCRSVEGCSLPGERTAEGRRVSGVYEGRIHPGDRIRLNRLAVYGDGITFTDPVETVRRELLEARQLGGEELIRREKKNLTVWRQRLLPILSAPDHLEETLHFSIYQLARTVGMSGLDSILQDTVLLSGRKKKQCLEEFLAGADQAAEYLTENDACFGRRMHSTHLIGAYAAMLGIAGILADGEHFSADPTLPEGWNGYVLPVLWQGRLLRISMGRSGAAIVLLSGEPARITWQGKEILLAAEGGKGCSQPFGNF